LPERLRQVREARGSMLVATVSLATLCVFMSLLILLPTLRTTILQPAVDVLVEGVGYSIRLASL